MLVTAIITAGGQGKRMGGKLPKQFLPLANKPLLAHTISPFQTCSEVGEIILVVPADHISFCHEVVANNQLSKVKKIIAGGEERATSVYNGLINVSKDTDYVLIHDGVRPFVNHALIRRVLEGAIKYGAAIPAIQVKDTVKSADPDAFVEKTIDRSTLISVQTPQAYRFNLLISAYQRFYQVGMDLTDECQLLEKEGYRVKIVPGEIDNLKITTLLDLELAEIIWQRKQKS